MSAQGNVRMCAGAGYELSQDLLDKQIEVLEKKYGGEKARNAALTIQRAFRRYALTKKFDSITAMAKAERRLSRRLQENFDSEVANFEKELQGGSKFLQARPAPLRSSSMREKRHLDSTSLPRSQSGCCDLGHQSIDYYTPTGLQPCILHTPPLSGSYRDNTHYYTPQEAFTEANHPVSHYPQCTHSSQSLQRDAFGRKSTTVVQRNTPPHQNGNSWNRQGSPSPSSYPSRPNSANKKIPPEVPKRTSSISCRSTPDSLTRTNGLGKAFENGSLSSVQSSGSDSSLSTDRVMAEGSVDMESRNRTSPVWKRKAQPTSPEHNMSDTSADISRKELSNTHTNSYQQVHDHSVTDSQHTLYKYRVGLNLFNKKPERGIAYLIKRGFLSNTPQAVASFLITRKGLSRQMIGEYLGNLQSEFNMEVLQCFSAELDLAGMQIDVALRKFQTYFRMPGEAQKIERLMEVFSQRYCSCNREVVSRLRSPDTVFVLAFAIIMLNTDLHTPNLKPERRMKLEDFIKNLRGIDDCGDIDRDMLSGIYERVKGNEFKPGNDHVTQVMKVQSNIVGKKPNLALPHRRLVCYCRLYELPDMYKKERPGVHQREVFLFNDLLVVTKIFSKKKNSVTYTFRESFPLCGMVVSTFEVPYYQYGIRLSQRVGGKVLITFNARNEHDRCKFAEDLRESISEMDEMENLRIEQELERQKSGRGRGGAPPENRDSGVADVEVCPYSSQAQDDNKRPLIESQLKRSALSNSLLDIHEQFVTEKPQQRRGSVGSLDSGMSISFQSTSASTVSRDSSPQNLQVLGGGGVGPGGFKNTKMMNHQQSFLGGIFAKRERKSSRAGQEECFTRTTEV
ncbi:IQ motif and Sec7 domain-containing protein, putative [Pediculus humanus corporis]|uniref:IQ motif and Sec7 domain-containing protein, putative n=1 Tax=Pediculus humanus subsp. corporis TaxID=121224 RepID=E0VA79_PEDHC|nr:IQ motif and Sec7 domain-containing protein, putative [Pediculus humanus corporis]EEB10285.1 IQ motif and Sec7 domain-containing protein, putative [Pediculus humanus corporis]